MGKLEMKIMNTSVNIVISNYTAAEIIQRPVYAVSNQPTELRNIPNKMCRKIEATFCNDKRCAWYTQADFYRIQLFELRRKNISCKQHKYRLYLLFII